MTPRVYDGALTLADDANALPIDVESTAWWEWLAVGGVTRFHVDEGGIRYTARRERKARGFYWYAYRWHGRALRKAYLGKSEDLTRACFRAAAERLTIERAPAAPQAAAQNGNGAHANGHGAPEANGNGAENHVPYAAEIFHPISPRRRDGAGRSMAVVNTGQDVLSLTPREYEVLRLIARGCSNAEIAQALYISLGTVKTHVNNLFGKLGVTNRAQAVVRGHELGVLS